MKLYINAWRQVFKRPRCIALAVVSSFLILALIIWIQNYKMLIYVISSGAFDLTAKVRIYWTTLASFSSSYNLSSRLLMISLAALSGINLSLLVYFLKNKRDLLRLAGLSGLGLLIGILGIGCGPCGLVVLSALLGLSATTTLAVILPWHGMEFGLLGVIILLTSIYLLLKRIAQGNSCRIIK